jgi:2-polyprenyl-6-methoxyphenol hydroxylase-like FAD-dependent oxidoreductase
MSPTAETHELAIVGYGPTGMMLAALAGRRGHSVIVLERYAGLYNLPRAACFDDEIMRIFQKLDLVEEVMPGTVVQPDYDWINASGETLVELTYDNPAPGGWAALYMMYQPHVETVLDRLCKALPSVEVHQGVSVEGLEQDERGVSLVATDIAGGERTEVRARYAIGADGGNSYVRERLGIGSSTYGFEENWLVCDFHKLRELDRVPTFRQVCDPVQPTSIVRIGPDHQRFSFMLEPDEKGDAATAPERVWQRVAEYITPADAELVRVANYVFRSRIADRWRDGRTLLAGDAAHEMPPFLAQGMCSGMRDAHNLAWKLDLILRGIAGDELLDSYQPEREPHVRFITEKAIELGQVQTIRDPEAARERDERLLAQRRENREPEKVRYPGLEGGPLIAGVEAGNIGEFFPQGRVRAGDREGLFDDVVGTGPCIVARGDALASIGPELRWGWREIGGRLALFADPAVTAPGDPEATELVDLDGLYRAWFDQNSREAAVVRPDWYLFGAAADGAHLAHLLEQVLSLLETAAKGSGIIAGDER